MYLSSRLHKEDQGHGMGVGFPQSNQDVRDGSWLVAFWMTICGSPLWGAWGRARERRRNDLAE
jgi:hypothetical protein